MLWHKLKAFFICIFLISLLGCSKNEPEIIGKTSEFTISSSIVKDDYPISVYQSPLYTGSLSNELIVVLDGELRFKDIVSIISEKTANGSIAPCLVVGIGNLKERNRDYTPTKYEYGKGGAETFYKFLKDELIPELKSRYNIQSNQKATLIGYSFGGLFVHYVMFQNRNDNPFNKFISGGCSFWYDSGVIFEYEKKYASNNTDLDVKFYSGMGSLEGGVSLGSFTEMTNRLKSRNYPRFQMKTETIKKHGHSDAANNTFKNGLNYLYEN
ncbi:esterase [bacterium 336/3]|nr:esterase [bacterium 336/3]